MTHCSDVHAPRQKGRMSALLLDGVKDNGPHFEKGQWWRTEGNHTVKLTHVGPIVIDGTIWKQVSGRRICFGQYSWRPSGSYFQTTTSAHDLEEQIDVPAWAEELGVAA